MSICNKIEDRYDIASLTTRMQELFDCFLTLHSEAQYKYMKPVKGGEVFFYLEDRDPKYTNAFEDDGFLHVIRGQARLTVYIGQEKRYPDATLEGMLKALEQIVDEFFLIKHKEISEAFQTNKKGHTQRSICSICFADFKGFGNNAQPVNNGRCCSECDNSVVIPARIRMLLNK